MRSEWIQLIAAFFGSLGFALIFGLRPRHLLPASLGGVLTWGIYLLVHAVFPRLFLANLIASVAAVGYSELLAHLRKSPATLFLVPAIIPLVPGGSLYEAMRCTVQGDLPAARTYGHNTLICALAIAAGISFGTVIRELRTPNKH